MIEIFIIFSILALLYYIGDKSNHFQVDLSNQKTTTDQKKGKKAPKTNNIPLQNNSTKHSQGDNLSQIEQIEINYEKKEIFNEIENTNKHIFVTGKAGTGKSHLLKYLKSNSKKQIVVCAPTGVAALNIKGQTIHSLFKIPPRFVHAEDVRLGYKVAEILRHIQIIVIDEISMVSAELLDVIDNLLRQARDPRIPFGGAQVVMFGDPFQLPPVVNHEELQKFFSEKHGGFHFFNAKVWENASFETHELQVLRVRSCLCN